MDVVIDMELAERSELALRRRQVEAEDFLAGEPPTTRRTYWERVAAESRSAIDALGRAIAAAIRAESEAQS